MHLSELTTYLSDRPSLTFLLPGGKRVPDHFHVTEVGETTKRFIDCGGTVRSERVASLQLWSATDYDHRLPGNKLADIIRLAQDRLGLGDLPVEVEYQGEQTIETYGLAVTDGELQLTGQQTDCLAREQCGIPEKPQVSLGSYVATGCTPGGGCC
jgi:hypothetical protein